MKLLRWTSALLAMLCLTGWFLLRKPYSPTQDLPPVAYSAFDLQQATPATAEALANAARTWEGVTAVSWNAGSRILVIAHESRIAEQDLLTHLNKISASSIALKVFPRPQGPECPFPHEAIMASFPSWLLYGGLVLGAFFSFSLYREKRRSLVIT